MRKDGNVARQIPRTIKERIFGGMRLIEEDIDAAYDAGTGFHGYPANRGRISVAEVLRRAGRVDKNTLKEPCYAELRAEVLKFVVKQESRLAAHNRSEARTKAKEALTNSARVDSFAQKFKAAEHRADAAEREAIAAKQEAKEREVECRDLKTVLWQARQEIADLRSQLSAGKVVKLRPRTAD